MNKFPIITDNMKELHLDERQARFFKFVQEQHGDQKRKYTGEPYWHHVAFVAMIVQQRIQHPELLIEVALGHDLYEDTKCGSGDLHKFMRLNGYEPKERIFIDNGIEALSDMYTHKLYPELSRSIRKGREARRMGNVWGGYQSVKYADLIHNTQSIVEFDPSFASVYLREKYKLLQYMSAGDSDLLKEAWETLRRAIKHLQKGSEND